ncbi:YchJ family protein [Jonesia denitrificans]|uniref:UPF0225 protein Jden_1581 n=1 Tax=Jonesia denitrificans (strain ATCC 14870 / DSM 20603 / BCRC 15368 / CIP 55.134 / JCM 11481 / NBRC 15587 / NCTC 10816 / Prevot 55134) TaxID=471856 RepID=C7R5F6_JONDD|nr:YchJ family metal-binding protein [Jonesia denitrificans]ACV09229.1 conserved hypothetical protein [Jonesia denitrificans DSM 20603]ASE09500.1 hypothetical protein CEP80_10425 [Jonesia denitrificans]QXB44045.1 hypothetical protein I6L70_04060 [Jonesia denitrificans]SQH21464.1 Uncharacterised protein [Jonesia denitrificans]
MTTPANRHLACPCGSSAPYIACCAPFHGHRATPLTPEQLMRSRYSAYTVGDIDYVRDTWHPDTRPDDLTLDDSLVWTRLRILDAPPVTGDTGYVTFRAHWRDGNARGSMTEQSRFVKVDGQWLYELGEVTQRVTT